MSKTREVLEEVFEERRRQDAKWGEQNWPDGTGYEGYGGAALALLEEHRDLLRKACDAAYANGTLTWKHIFDEEVAEALAEKDPANLRTELLQVAAVAVAWVGAIDRRGGK